MQHADLETAKLDTNSEDKFVTVLSVSSDKNINDKDPTRDKIMESTYSKTPNQEKPHPAPRQFVTVVSIDSKDKVCLADDTVSLKSQMKIRLDVSRSEKSTAENKEKSPIPDQIVVYRLPGERLGFGLKFDGGSEARENIRRLFIQSVAPDSPAARASVPWGNLNIGDQIMHIDGISVTLMTRAKCVTSLKNASVKLTIGVIRGPGSMPDIEEEPNSTVYNKIKTPKKLAAPCVPPRSIYQRNHSRSYKFSNELLPPEGFDDDPLFKYSSNRKLNGGELVNSEVHSKYSSPKLPPQPSHYVDLLGEDNDASYTMYESESDETNSSVSTVVDRLSISSSQAVSRNSSFSNADSKNKFDLAKALSQFENLEKEFNYDKKSVSNISASIENKTSKVTSQNGDRFCINGEKRTMCNANWGDVKSNQTEGLQSLLNDTNSFVGNDIDLELNCDVNLLDDALHRQRSNKEYNTVSGTSKEYAILQNGPNHNIEKYYNNSSLNKNDIVMSTEIKNNEVSDKSSQIGNSRLSNIVNSKHINYLNMNITSTPKPNHEMCQNSLGSLPIIASKSQNIPDYYLDDSTNEPIDAVIPFIDNNDYFINQVSNPSYDFHHLPYITSNNCKKDKESDEIIYEEIIETDTNFNSSRDNEPLSNINQKVNSNMSNDTIIERQCVDQNKCLSEEQINTRMRSESNQLSLNHQTTNLSHHDTPTEDFHEYDYIDIKPNINSLTVTKIKRGPKTSLDITKDSRLRNNLTELLRKNLKLDKNDEIIVEEEEEVESVFECKNEDELNLVLRALKSNNYLSLNEKSSTTESRNMIEVPQKIVSGEFIADDRMNGSLCIESQISSDQNSVTQKTSSGDTVDSEIVMGHSEVNARTASTNRILENPSYESCYINNDRFPDRKMSNNEQHSQYLSQIKSISSINNIQNGIKTLKSNDSNDLCTEEINRINTFSNELDQIALMTAPIQLSVVPEEETSSNDSSEWIEIPVKTSNESSNSEESCNYHSLGKLENAGHSLHDLKASASLYPARPTIEAKWNDTPQYIEGHNGNSNLALYQQHYVSTQENLQPHSRLPPDGREYPSQHSESIPDKTTRNCRQSQQFEEEDVNIHKTKSHFDSRAKSRWRRQDERSEKSVRDKIAMFSIDKDHPRAVAQKLERSDSLNSDSISRNCSFDNDLKADVSYHEVLSKKNSLPERKSTRSSLGQHQVKSMVNVNSSGSASNENLNASRSQARKSKDIQEMRRSKMSSAKIESLVGLNKKSQSLINIGDSSKLKRHSVGAYDRSSIYKFGVEKPEEKERRASLNNMIEQRRKSISKLRGLVIPETKVIGEGKKTPVDLPKIGSQKITQTVKNISSPRGESKRSIVSKTDSFSSVDSSSSIDTKHISNTQKLIGKSSRLRKVSSESARSACSTSSTYSVQYPNESLNYSKRLSSPQRCIDKDSLPLHDSGIDVGTKREKFAGSRTLPCELSLCKSEDSDNDSAVSSTQSGFSQSFSPRGSPMLDPSDQDDSTSSAAFSRPSHSSQSSFEDFDSKRSTNNRFEAENRRNIINSAKVSSGKSFSENIIPEITTKYSNEKSANFETNIDTNRIEIKSTVSGDSLSYIDVTDYKERSPVKEFSINRKDSSPPKDYFEKNSEPEFTVKETLITKDAENFELGNLESSNNTVQLPKLTIEQVSTVTDKKDIDKKWADLEQKYSSKAYENDRIGDKSTKYENILATEFKNRYGAGSKKTDFKTVASEWKKRAEGSPSAPQPKSKLGNSKEGFVSYVRSNREETFHQNFVKSVSKSVDHEGKNLRPSNLELPLADVPDRKFSVPEYGLSVKLRDRKDGSGDEIPSRPASLIETTNSLHPLQEGQYMAPLSPSSISTDSRDELLDSSESSLSRAGSKEILDAFLKPQLGMNPKMSEIMRAFERSDFGRRGGIILGGSHPRMSSLDSTMSEDGSPNTHYGSVTSLSSGQRDQYGSITSLSSSTSIISPQELAQLIEEANHSLDESGTPSHEILVVVLHRELVGHGSIGITLAGGADYETKEITVHKVIPGSLADRDGRILKGDRVLSINGKTLRGVGHREALNILKAPRPEVVLVLSRSRSVTPQESTITHCHGDAELAFCHRPVYINHITPARPPKILESPLDSKSLISDVPIETTPRAPPTSITFIKDGAGLGFSLEGGKDSPLGDRPLTVKKVFSGGAADKAGVLGLGDQLMSVNNVDLSNMARIEAWNFLKKLPDGKVMLVIRKKLEDKEVTSKSENEK